MGISVQTVALSLVFRACDTPDGTWLYGSLHVPMVCVSSRLSVARSAPSSEAVVPRAEKCEDQIWKNMSSRIG